MSIKDRLIKHPSIETLVTVKGNTKVALYTEPLWSVPFFLFTPFVAVYMRALLLSDIQIGIVTSIFLFTRTLTALFSGAVTDKLGRRKTTFIFDILSWSIPCLLWAFSQNFWWFVVGASFNGIMQMTHNSWTCILVEDVKKETLFRIFFLLNLLFHASAIFAPLAIVLVNQLSIIPALRIIYLFSFVSMTTKFIILYKYGDETKVGKVRLEETKDMSVWNIMSGYRKIFKDIFTSGDMVFALIITTVFNITAMIHGTFFGLYVTGTLLLPEYQLAYFPIIRSATIVASLYLVQPKLSKLGFRNPMLIGLVIFVASNIMLIHTPEKSFFILSIYILFDAIAFSFVMPRSDSLTQMLIEPSERARISGLMMVIVLGLSIPFGSIAGWLSELDRRFPFLLIIAFFVAVFVVILVNKKRLKKIKTT